MFTVGKLHRLLRPANLSRFQGSQAPEDPNLHISTQAQHKDCLLRLSNATSHPKLANISLQRSKTISSFVGFKVSFSKPFMAVPAVAIFPSP